MTSRARTRGLERPTARIGDVGFVVRGVEVLAIPAAAGMSVPKVSVSLIAESYLRREGDRRPDPAFALLQRQVRGVVAGTRGASEGILLDVAVAPVAELLLLSLGFAEHRVTDQHSESLSDSGLGHPWGRAYQSIPPTHLLECRHLCLAVVRRNIVHCDALIALQAEVDHLRHSLERPVPRLEVQIGGPVVGEVLAECAACAGRLLGGIHDGGIHAGVERVAPDDLVVVRRPDHPGVDQGIEAFDDELRASEPQHRRRGTAS